MPVTYTSEDANNDFQPRFKITNCLPRLQSHKVSWKRFFYQSLFCIMVVLLVTDKIQQIQLQSFAW